MAVNIKKYSVEKSYTHNTNEGKMVYYFNSNTVAPAAFIYVGKDKVESKYFSLGSYIY